MKILAISDQHGHLPEIPPCDLLLVGGDQCPDVVGGVHARKDGKRQWRWFEDVWLPWRYAQPVRTCVVTWGNHDYCGLAMPEFSESRPDGSRRKVTHVLCDKAINAEGLRIYCTPWSNQFLEWAFMREPAELVKVYANIPSGLDILVSHQPPLGFGSRCTYLDPRDGQMKTEEIGSIELGAAILAATPQVVVCGHVHSGYGTYDMGGLPVYNVSVVDEGYALVHPPTVVERRR